MSRVSSPHGEYVFAIVLKEGKGFPPGTCIEVQASFGGDQKSFVSDSDANGRCNFHEVALEWRVTKEKLRQLASVGADTCKVTCLTTGAGPRGDQRSLGWLVLDTRTAKLHGKLGAIEQLGSSASPARSRVAPVRTKFEKLPLTGTQHLKKVSQAELTLNYVLKDALLLAKSSPTAARDETSGRERVSAVPRVGDNATGTRASEVSEGQETDVLSSISLNSAARSSPAGQAAGDGLGKTGVRRERAVYGSETTLRALDGPTRRFKFTLDVKSFQSGHRMPVSLATVFVEAHLPQELKLLLDAHGGEVPPAMAPLVTRPAVAITRGTEGILPRSCECMEFTASVMELTEMLQQDPRILVEVNNREKFRADTLLGVASVPLQPLLGEAWVEGYASVFAYMLPGGAPESRPAAGPAPEKVQIGSLRVSLALDDLGPGEPSMLPPHSQPAAPAQPLVPELSASTLLPPARGDVAAAATPTPDAALPSPPRSTAEVSSGAALAVRDPPSSGKVEPTAAPAAPLLPPQRPAALEPAAASRPRQAQVQLSAAEEEPSPADLQAAWELEVWKKAEEAKFRAQLQQRESQRMAAIEGEWRRREQARETELEEAKERYSELTRRNRETLTSLQAREQQLLVAEEAVARRKKELQRELTSRVTDAEATVRRLQAEFEHQLQMEQSRVQEVARQKADADTALTEATVRIAALQEEVDRARDAAQARPETELAREIAELKVKLEASQAHADKALRLKDEYKAQVVMLTKELAALHKQAYQHSLAGSPAALPPPPLHTPSPAPAAAGFAGQAAPGTLSWLQASLQQQHQQAEDQQRLAELRARLEGFRHSAGAVLLQTAPPPAPQPHSAGSPGPAAAAWDAQPPSLADAPVAPAAPSTAAAAATPPPPPPAASSSAVAAN